MDRMSTNNSSINLTLTDLENLNLGQLVRLYQAASGTNRTDPPTDQQNSQRLGHFSAGQLDLDGHDSGADFYQTSARNSRTHLLANQRNSPPHLSHTLSTSNFDTERGGPLHDLGRAVKRNISTRVLGSQRNSRPRTPGQYDDAVSEPDLELGHEAPQADPITSPMSQYKAFHPNIHQLDIGWQLHKSRPAYPAPAFVSHYGVADIPEDDVIGPATPFSTRWRSLHIAGKPAEVLRTWSRSRSSTGHASRRSKRSLKVPRKPLPELLTWSGPTDPNNPVNWSAWRKRVIVLAASVITFAVSYTSSIFSTAVTPIAHKFHTSEEVVILGVSLYVLGFALGRSAFSRSTILY
jgi:hypothetical protein